MTNLKDSSTDSTPQATRELIRYLREGDAKAALLLDQIYRDSLIRFCWGYLGRMEEAEDAVQEICYKVLTADKVPDYFRSWIYKMARNLSINMIRDRVNKNGDKAQPTVSQVQDVLTGHLTRMVKDEQQQSVTELIEKLSQEHKEVLRLRYVEDLSRQEIAEVLDLDESVIKSRLFEGLKKLREFSEILDR